MKRLLGLIVGGALVAGSAGAALAQNSSSDGSVKQSTKNAARSTKNAAKSTGKAVKHGTKKVVNKGASATRKGAGKVEQKTQ